MGKESKSYTFVDIDDAIIEKACKGSEEAFLEIYNHYSPILYNFVKRRLQQEMDAEDVFQSVWTSIYKSLPRYKRANARFSTWLFTIASNRLIDCFRSNRVGARSDYDELQEFHSVSEDNGNSAEARKDNYQLLEEGISQLSEKLAIVVRLRMQGVPFNEIARQRDLSINTVLAQYRYALDGLKTFFRKHGIGKDDII